MTSWRIAEGKIKTNLDGECESLRWLIEEGYPDEYIMSQADEVEREIKKLRQAL